MAINLKETVATKHFAFAAWRTFAYLFLAGILLVSVELYQNNQTHRLRQLHAQICSSFLTIRSNQEFVLATEKEIIRTINDRASLGLRKIPADIVQRIEQHLALARQADCRP